MIKIPDVPPGGTKQHGLPGADPKDSPSGGGGQHGNKEKMAANYPGNPIPLPVNPFFSSEELALDHGLGH